MSQFEAKITGGCAWGKQLYTIINNVLIKTKTGQDKNGGKEIVE